MSDSASAGISKNVTLLISAIAMFVGSFIGSSANIALPTIGKEFATEAVLLGWIANAPTLSSLAVLLPAGRLADIYGRKKIFSYGILLFVVSSSLCAIANSAISLIFYRILQGIGMGMTGGNAVAILTSVFPAQERGKAFGINVAATYFGLSLGPFLGGVLTQHLGWRSIFFLSVFLCLMVAALIYWGLKGEWADARGEKFDVAGSIVLGISLVVGMYGFTVLPTMTGIILVLLGVLGMLAFVRWEAKVASPIINVGIFRKNVIFVFSNLAVLISYAASFAVSFLLSLYLQYIKGFPPQTAGLILVTPPAFMALFAPLAGRLSDRIEPRIVASIGVVFIFLSLVMLVFLDEETSLGFIIGSLALFGFGLGLFSSPNMNAVMGSVEKKFFGVASGTVGMMRSCGMALSLGLTMILFSIFIGKAQITPEYYPAFLASTKIDFAISAALCFGGIFAQLAGRKTPGIDNKNPGRD